MYKSFSMELAGRTLTVDIGRVCAQANGAAQAGPDMNAGADNSSYQSDDVVDGDYKEV